jgi:PhoP regulatory network protein YrbL.
MAGTFFSRKIDLNTWRPIASGASRIVYIHDDYPDTVLKVIREDRRGPGGTRKLRSKRNFYRHLKRFGVYQSFSREFDEFLEQARKVDGSEDVRLPIARIFGFVHTTKGLGMLTERISGPDGEIAPTLRTILAREGATPEIMAMLHECFEEMRARHIVLADCSLENFVVTTDSKGLRRMVCIDGTGDKSAVHIYAVCPFLNGLHLKRYLGRMKQKIDDFLAAQEGEALSPGSLHEEVEAGEPVTRAQ